MDEKESVLELANFKVGFPKICKSPFVINGPPFIKNKRLLWTV